MDDAIDGRDVSVFNVDGDKILIDDVVGETNLKTVLPLFVADISK